MKSPFRVNTSQPYNKEYYQAFIAELNALQERYGITIGFKPGGFYLVPRAGRSGYASIGSDGEVSVANNFSYEMGKANETSP